MAHGIGLGKLGNSPVVRLCQTDVIQAIEQAMLVERIDLEAVRGRYSENGFLELTAVMSVYMMNANILRVMEHRPRLASVT